MGELELDRFIDRFGSANRSYWFYNNTVELSYDDANHVYYLVTPEGLIAQDGVTDTCHIIDKSEALIPWACKMMANKILSQGYIKLPDTYAEFESLVLAAKAAHREKLEEAANIGHIAHRWIEQYIEHAMAGGAINTAPELPANPQASSCCRAAVTWMVLHNIRWIHTEAKVYSKEHRYAGTMDGLCTVDSCADRSCCREQFKDRLSLADWKSSNALRVEYILQTAAYANAYEEEFDEMDEVIEDRWVIRLGKEDGLFEPWHLEGRKSFLIDRDAFLSALALKRSLAQIARRVKDREYEIRAGRKAEKKAAKEEALTLKCNRADRYKGIRYPGCNDGNPCTACLTKYNDLHKGEQ